MLDAETCYNFAVLISMTECQGNTATWRNVEVVENRCIAF